MQEQRIWKEAINCAWVSVCRFSASNLPARAAALPEAEAVGTYE